MLKMFLALLLLAIPGTAYANPLSQFAGHYTGQATGILASGAKESLTCRATNGFKEATLTIALRCANSSGARFEARAKVQGSGTTVSGTWQIIDPSYDGTLSGTVRGETITANIAGSAVSGMVTVSRLPLLTKGPEGATPTPGGTLTA